MNKKNRKIECNFRRSCVTIDITIHKPSIQLLFIIEYSRELRQPTEDRDDELFHFWKVHGPRPTIIVQMPNDIDTLCANPRASRPAGADVRIGTDSRDNRSEKDTVERSERLVRRDLVFTLEL